MKQKAFLGFFLVGVVGFLFSVQSASAAPGDIEGWAWGGGVTVNPAGYDGIGWISMNSTNCDSDANGFLDVGVCGGNNTTTISYPYAVNIPTTDGNLSGYAWSEHYGWISFNASDVAGCPAGTCQPRRENDALLGWARILAIPAAGANAGGWSGWVSLSSQNASSLPAYGLQISKMKKQSLADVIADPSSRTYAYSDELGWIDFSMAGYGAGYAICPESHTMLEGETRSFNAYYNPTGAVDCLNTAGATKVTDKVTWSPVTPAVAIVIDQGTGTVKGVSSGSSSITTSAHLGKTAPAVTANVTCASDYATLCAAQAPNYCPADTISITDRCGTVTTSCTGTRNCDYNWKEVAP